jgi:hypothetical protein
MIEICYRTCVCRVWGSLSPNTGQSAGLLTKETDVKLVIAQYKTWKKCLLLCEGQNPAPSIIYFCDSQCSKDLLWSFTFPNFIMRWTEEIKFYNYWEPLMVTFAVCLTNVFENAREYMEKRPFDWENIKPSAHFSTPVLSPSLQRISSIPLLIFSLKRLIKWKSDL